MIVPLWTYVLGKVAIVIAGVTLVVIGVLVGFSWWMSFWGRYLEKKYEAEDKAARDEEG